jgi:hypothetical protein
MSNVTEVLRGELSALMGEVEKLEVSITRSQADLKTARDKAEHIEGLLALYGNASGRPIHHRPITARPALGNPQEEPRALSDQPAKETVARGRESKAVAVRKHILDLLTVRGRMHRQDILDSLTAAGLMGHEKTPLASLAAYLSTNRDSFEADGRGNFTLRKKINNDLPPAPGRGETGGVAPPVPA